MNQTTPSETPETGWHAEYVKASNRAIEMERQRNEARAERDDWFSVLTLKTKELGDARAQLAEARDICDKWEAEHAACLKTANDSLDAAEEAVRQRDALADALRDILKADEECEAEFAKMGIPPEEHWTTAKAKAAIATLNQKDQ